MKLHTIYDSIMATVLCWLEGKYDCKQLSLSVYMLYMRQHTEGKQRAHLQLILQFKASMLFFAFNK